VEKSASVPKRRFTDALGEYLAELGEKDDRVIAITSAMRSGTGLELFREKFPNRFYDVGIAESAAVDIAAGLAKTGLKPVVCIYSTFLQRSFDQIFQEVALQNLPVVFCLDRAGFVGDDGPTHHGRMDIGFLRMMPNMVLVAPADDVELKLALEFALSQDKPVCVRYPKDTVPVDEYDRSACAEPFHVGKSVIVKSSDEAVVSIVSYGPVLTQALGAAKLLAEEGIEAEVINARFAAPIDRAILQPDRPIITVEDHGLSCGFGSALMEEAAGCGEAGKVIVPVGSPRKFVKHDRRSEQLIQVGISVDNMVRTAKDILNLGRLKDAVVSTDNLANPGT
jgi:1-deoxy-D-xylulose-5-phosphate synthase